MLAKLAARAWATRIPNPLCGRHSQSRGHRHRHPLSPQRNHDALTAGLRALLASGELGRHNGLPASIIVTTTLAELEAAAGQGLTGAGTILPMSDVIRLAATPAII
ncbi:hypothetical protein BZL30_1937 [Mycobacterium kansasii]|uniref:DUF222 domain-containing protein n=1 Tax=Mycobacterium kansasii TaxID=1768 RepID=A0A1V3XI52_MYCKA|nr:hypothetical protein BZL30_1937 [Mycobacterium kansasii]